MYYLSALGYYLLLMPLSLLPFKVLYWLSDGIAWLLFNVIGYRKNVVLSQLRNSFPEKTEAEIQTIARKFYAHIADMMVESVKLFTISEAEARKRFICKNPEICNQFYDKNQSIILCAGHYNNFEYVAAMLDFGIKHKAMGLYKKLNNPFFEEKIRSSRGRFGSGLVVMKEFKNFMTTNLKNDKYCVMFGMDQWPLNYDKAHWMQFLNQDTGVQFGTEKYARDFDLPVVYAYIKKTKRGHYEAHFEEITRTPREVPHAYIIETMTQLLERDIRQAPEFWLWSHRRWKHPRPAAKS